MDGFANADEAMAYLRGAWNQAMAEVPQARRPKAMRHGWLVGHLPADVIAVLVETDTGVDEYEFAACGNYAIASLEDAGGWSLYEVHWPVLRPVAPLVTSSAVFSETEPAPPVTASVMGTGGIGTTVQSEAGPVRWLLLEGYCYHLDQDAGPWAVYEAPATDGATSWPAL